VFWHTQGSGKSYSMVFFTWKVRRKLRGVFTFVLMTDRDDLDEQIYRTFGGCGVIDLKTTPRASSGLELKKLLGENHAYVFTLIHKFNQDVTEAYSERDDIIVISDEAHRTQAGKFAINMRKALPNASFLGFTGTPLLKNDEITKRIFGRYVSRYDFKRSEEDGATVKLVYENRGEKLGITTLDLNDRIAEVIEEARLTEDEDTHLQKLLGKDYEVVTAGERLERIAVDFVNHCAARWESGKFMMVCIDKITCGRMFNLIMPHWQAKTAAVKAAAGVEVDAERKAKLEAQAKWLEETIIELQISEEQGEVKAFQKWGVDIIPRRARMKKGFEVLKEGRTETLSMEDAFKEPGHPFRVVIVCAMWLTGFDVESLGTLYIDKPMKAHTLMQAIARANRRCEGKDFGLIVDYNGMLKSLCAALANYALGDEGEDAGDEIVAPISERVEALEEAISATETYLLGLGFDASQLGGAKGFTKTGLLADAVNAIYTNRETKQRFEIMTRQVFLRFKALIMEEAVFAFAERHDNLEAIYKKLEERRDMSDVTAVLKQLHLIVNEAIRTQSPGGDQTEAKLYDLSQIDMEKLRDEFAKKVIHKATAVEDLSAMIEEKLALMMRSNPERMDFYRRYSEIVADYNKEKDRVTIEETFAQLVSLLATLNEEQRRAAEEGLNEDELAIFDLLKKEKLTEKQREAVKAASKHLLAKVLEVVATRHDWIAKEPTKAEVEVLIQTEVFTLLPDPPFDEDEKLALADRVFQHVFAQSAVGALGTQAA
jgi:type I restriction enzyme R subunit